jgi:DNA processing protein
MAIPGMGPVRIKAVVSHAETVRDVYSWKPEDFARIPGFSLETGREILRNLNRADAEKRLEWADRHDIEVICLADSGYPASLRDLYDPPAVLFIKGGLIDCDSRAVAMVGSRRSTEYGKTAAYSLARDLAQCGLTVVSGMALGIDSISHRGALENGGRTIAVLGSGIDRIYPPENKGLYEQIAAQGAVVSEFFPGTEPHPAHFPRRNRIISGLGQAVIVVEAGERSGALLTADYAIAQDRPLFAVPGNFTSKLSAGTNDLIKCGARPITGIEDLFSVLPRLRNDYIPPERIMPDDLTEDERKIYTRLSAEPIYLDTLVRMLDIPASEAVSYLLGLELRGLVRQLSGKRFVTT